VLAERVEYQQVDEGPNSERRVAMKLSDFHLNASIAVSDITKAREFYEGKLGLAASQTGADGSQIYVCGSGASLHVYPSPDNAGKTGATLATWYVDDIERMVDELAARGVSFARYDGIPADSKGIAQRAGGGRVTWFTDPDGNTFAIEADA
jgi:catechol 2,3-dioxygenase-like lactoylglutathione lyase family enzyme